MELTFILRHSPDFVFDHLTEIDKFIAVHPVITRMVKTGPDRYKVYETLPLWIIPFSFTYPATVHFSREGYQVIMQATVFGLTKVDISFVLKPGAGYTRVEEHIYFSSPLPVKTMMGKVFRKQHTLLFENIDSLSGEVSSA